MKKIIFLLLLAQTISFITADSGCMKYPWGLGESSPENPECYCTCERNVQVITNRRKCNECAHFRIPKQMKINTKHISPEALPAHESRLENIKSA